jgi:hypothetical protein
MDDLQEIYNQIIILMSKITSSLIAFLAVTIRILVKSKEKIYTFLDVVLSYLAGGSFAILSGLIINEYYPDAGVLAYVIVYLSGHIGEDVNKHLINQFGEKKIEKTIDNIMRFLKLKK